MGSLLGRKKEQIDASGPRVVFETNQGVIEIGLMPTIAPKACENFTKLVEKGYYNGTIFHRVIKGFMLQGGDPEGTGAGGSSIWGKPFEDEVSPKVKFDREGLLAMANRGSGTNGSQFFITTGKPSHLNMKHTIFGEVLAGMDVVKKIDATPTSKPQNRPTEDQKIQKAFVKK
jgi:peptidylprolyl isomerase